MNEPVGSDTVDDNAEVQAQRKGDAEEDQGAKKVRIVLSIKCTS